MMSKPVLRVHHLYYVLWCLIHAIISCVQFIHKYLYLKFKTKRSLDTDSHDDRLVRALNKIPQHIALCVNERTLESKKLCQLIRWCERFRVRYVSLYSHYDTFLTLNQLEKHLIGFETNGRHKETAEEEPLTHRKNGFTNTPMNGKTKRVISIGDLEICIFTPDDSHQSIVRAAKHLCCQIAPIDQNMITEYLKKSYSFPDPELLISFGGSPSVYGYPLWQLRLTEMYFLPTHRDIQFDDFYEILDKYSRCEQRCGK